MPVTDKDIADEIRRVAPGSTWDDVMAAWDCVRGRLDSHDDSRTVYAFREVADRYAANIQAAAKEVRNWDEDDAIAFEPEGAADMLPCDVEVKFHVLFREDLDNLLAVTEKGAGDV